MKHRIKTLWTRRPRLSRGERTARNFLLIALVWLFLWGLSGFPLPPALDFRRTEAANWVGPADLQGTLRTTRGQWTLGVYGEWVLLGPSFHTFEYWPREETGATLVPLPDSPSLEGEAWIAAVEVPEGTAEARLQVRADCWWVDTPGGGKILRATRDPEADHWEGREPRRWSYANQVDGERVTDDLFLFHVATGETSANSLEWRVVSTLYEWETYSAPPERRTANCALEAVFYDGNGGELSRASLDALEN